MVREILFSKHKKTNPFKNFVVIEGFYDVDGTGWASYMLTHNMPEMVADLRKGLDEESNKLLDIIFQRITILPKGWWDQYRIRESHMRSPLLQTPEEAEINGKSLLPLASTISQRIFTG